MSPEDGEQLYMDFYDPFEDTSWVSYKITYTVHVPQTVKLRYVKVEAEPETC